MTAPTTVFYTSSTAGAPAGATNTAGGLIAVLDACLVNGFNAISVTGITQTAGVATATTATNHNFSVGDVVSVAGATPTAYNGWQRVTGKTSNTFTYAVDSGTATPATGTLTAKHPGAGWVKSFAGTNTAGYQGSTAGLGHHVQVEDDNPYSDSHATARIRMAAGLTGLDAGTQLAEQCRLDKGATGWVLVADSKTCYLVFDKANTLCFGEFASLSAGDGYAWFLNRGRNATSEGRPTISVSTGHTAGGYFPLAGASENEFASHLSNDHGAKILRSYSQMGGDVEAVPGHTAFVATGANGYASSVYGVQRVFNAINPADGALGLAPVMLAETSSTLMSMRGTLRGLYQPMGLLADGSFDARGTQRMDDTLINGQIRSIAVVQCGSATYRAQLAFDLGNWG